MLCAQPVLACEVCVEDHVAATYDFQVMSRAEAAGRSGGSVRFSAVPPAASFAWDPQRLGFGEIIRTVNARLAGDGLTLVALRVITPAKGITAK